MVVTVNNEDVRLNPAEVKYARKQLSGLFRQIQTTAKKYNRQSYYFTFLIMANVMSSLMLDEMDEKTLKKIVESQKKPRE